MYLRAVEPLSKARRKQLRALTTRKGREEAGLFIAEGPRLVEEALRAGAVPRYVVVCDALVSAAQRARVDGLLMRPSAFSATEDELADGADTVHSQGMLAVFPIPAPDLGVLDRPRLTLVVLDNVRDPGNLGTIARHAAAFGADALLLTEGCVDPWNGKAVRASMGGLFHVPVLPADALPEDVALYAASRGGADVYSTSFPQRVALIVGSEAGGVGPDLMARATPLGIPQTDRVESLNAATAASIVLSWRYQSA